MGFKFCGGCNPVYDRRAAYEKIRSDVCVRAAERGVEVSFEPVREGVRYDALLVICGCANRCASLTAYDPEAPRVYVYGEGGVSDAGLRLAALV
ncbi:MAG: hypothetical protein LBS67_06820 [Clostridiales Family XIII bacterium]|nr:hypothetical protein [Clostridiales Family XIII bacterium]